MEELVGSVTSNRAKEKIMSLAEKLMEEGREEGREVGVLIGRILTYQDLLKESSNSVEGLKKMKVDDLRKLAGVLKTRLAV
jgi:predicted transposase YdaD